MQIHSHGCCRHCHLNNVAILTCLLTGRYTRLAIEYIGLAGLLVREMQQLLRSLGRVVYVVGRSQSSLHRVVEGYISLSTAL